MKYMLVECAVLVLLTSGSCTTHQGHQHGKTRDFTSKVLLAKAPAAEVGHDKWLAKAKKADEQGTCRVVCDNDVDVPTDRNVTKYADGSWSYELQVDKNFFIQIGYNKTKDFMAIFNPSLNLTWVTDGMLIGIFNITADALFLIDTTRNLASIFTNITRSALDTTLNGAFNLMTFFGAQFRLMLKNSLDMTTNFAFKVDGFLKALRDRTIGTFFQGRLGLENVFKVDFGFYINGSMQYNGFGAFLQPIVGFGQFSMEVVNNINDGIVYGTKLTLSAVEFIFTGLGRVALDINNSLRQLVTNSVGTFFNITTGSIQGVLGFGTSLLNALTGRVGVSGGGNINITASRNNGNGFLINYGNSTGVFIMNYNTSLNTLSFFNSIRQLVMVADGSTGVYMVFNVTSAMGLVVNSTGYATLLSEHSEVITGIDHLDLESRFAMIAQLLQNNDNINMSSDMSFDFNAYLRAYFNGEMYFESGNTLSLLFYENFGDLLSKAKETNAGDLFAEFGVSAMFNVVYGSDVISVNFAKFMNSVYLQNGGRFSVKIMNEVYESLQKNIKAGGKGFNSYIFNGVLKACLRGGLNLFGIRLGFGNKC